MKHINHFESTWDEVNEIIHAMKNALMTIHLIEQKLAETRSTLGEGIDATYKAINEMVEEKNGKVQNAEDSQETQEKRGTQESKEE